VTLRNALLACGVASSLLYVASIDVLAAIAEPQYHSYTYRMVSELFAVGSPTRSLLGPPMIVYNLLVFAFAVGVWMAAGADRITRAAAVALGVYATISTMGFVVAAMEVRGPGGMTERDVLHIVATVVQGFALLSALVLGAFMHGRRFRRYSVGTLVITLVFSALAGLFARRPSTPWLGVTERVSIYAWMLWVGVFGSAFLAAGDTSSSLRGGATSADH
jgi:hypothetical protein